MTRMVEKVAIALHELEGSHKWSDASDGEKRSAVRYARAAIEAMEPTGFIEEAGWQRLKPMLSEDWLSLDQVGEVFKAMIDASLKEEMP